MKYTEMPFDESGSVKAEKSLRVDTYSSSGSEIEDNAPQVPLTPRRAAARRRSRREVSNLRKKLQRPSPGSIYSTDASSQASSQATSLASSSHAMLLIKKATKPPLYVGRSSPYQEPDPHVFVYGNTDITPLPSPKSEPCSPCSQSEAGRMRAFGFSSSSSPISVTPGYQAEDSSSERQLHSPPTIQKITGPFPGDEDALKVLRSRSASIFTAKSTPITSIDEDDDHKSAVSKASDSSSVHFSPQPEIELALSIDDMVVGIEQMIEEDFADLFQRDSDELVLERKLSKASGSVSKSTEGSVGKVANEKEKPSTATDFEKTPSVEEMVAGLEAVMSKGAAAILDDEPEVCVDDLSAGEVSHVSTEKDDILMSKSMKDESKQLAFRNSLKSEEGVELSIQTSNLSTKSSLTASVPHGVDDEIHQLESWASTECDIVQSPMAVNNEKKAEEANLETQGSTSSQVLSIKRRPKEQMPKVAVHIDVGGVRRQTESSSEDDTRTNYRRARDRFQCRRGARPRRLLENNRSENPQMGSESRTPQSSNSARGKIRQSANSCNDRGSPSDISVSSRGTKTGDSHTRRSSHTGQSSQQSSLTGNSHSSRSSHTGKSSYSSRTGNLRISGISYIGNSESGRSSHTGNSYTTGSYHTGNTRTSRSFNTGNSHTSRSLNTGNSYTSRSSHTGNSHISGSGDSLNSYGGSTSGSTASLISACSIPTSSTHGPPLDCHLKPITPALKSSSYPRRDYDSDATPKKNPLSTTSLERNCHSATPLRAKYGFSPDLLSGRDKYLTAEECLKLQQERTRAQASLSESESTSARLNAPSNDSIGPEIRRVLPPRPPKQTTEDVVLVDSDDSRESGVLNLDSFRVFESETEDSMNAIESGERLAVATDEIAALKRKLKKQSQEITSQKVFLEQQAHDIALLKMERDLLQADLIGARQSGEGKTERAQQQQPGASIFDHVFTTCNSWSQQWSTASDRFVCGGGLY